MIVDFQCGQDVSRRAVDSFAEAKTGIDRIAKRLAKYFSSAVLYALHSHGKVEYAPMKRDKGSVFFFFYFY